MNNTNCYLAPVLFACCALLYSTNVLPEQKAKKSYTVDFNNPPEKTETLNEIKDRINSTFADQPNMRMMIYGRGLAFFLDPGTIQNTSLQFNSNNQSAQKEIADLKSKNVDLIVCEKPENRSIRKITTDLDGRHLSTHKQNDRITHLKQQGYICIKP